MSQLSDYSLHCLVIGGYTPDAGGAGLGLSVAERDRRTGALQSVGAPTSTPAPSFVVSHPTLPIVYAVNELAEGRLSAFGYGTRTEPADLAAGELLRPLGSVSTQGTEPCHLSIDPTGRHLVAANYASGSIASFVLSAEGEPTLADLVEHSGGGPHPERQTGPHPHHVGLTDGGVTVVDLGLDLILRYALSPTTGELASGEIVAKLPSGTGPRHFVTSSQGWAYLVGELAGTVLTFRTEDGAWDWHSTVPASAVGDTFPSEIALSPDERFLYVGNRGPNTIAIFSVERGEPTLIGEVATGGDWPRHLVIVEPFLYVANQRSHTVAVFRLDPGTGLLRPTGDLLPTPSPACLLPLVISARPHPVV